MKQLILLVLLCLFIAKPSPAQLKEALQLATLTPAVIVATSDIENYKKMHYTLSTVGYLGTYMITESVWKSAAITLGMGLAKELVYDLLLGRGEPLLEDMKWNTLGVLQGAVFTVSLKF